MVVVQGLPCAHTPLILVIILKVFFRTFENNLMMAAENILKNNLSDESLYIDFLNSYDDMSLR
jgi:hypothetical protein